MDQLLNSGAKFSAIFAQSDMLALGALNSINARGLRVPDDVSIIGYDDIPVASFLNPPLTTMRQPIRDVGALAARLLIDAITRRGSGERDETNRHLLSPQLVVRDSVSSRS
jgi:DNA-binding LacI/PurR family transcriptional regulator